MLTLSVEDVTSPVGKTAELFYSKFRDHSMAVRHQAPTRLRNQRERESASGKDVVPASFLGPF